MLGTHAHTHVCLTVKCLYKKKYIFVLLSAALPPFALPLFLFFSFLNSRTFCCSCCCTKKKTIVSTFSLVIFIITGLLFRQQRSVPAAFRRTFSLFCLKFFLFCLLSSLFLVFFVNLLLLLFC